MNPWGKLGICVAISFGGHFLLTELLAMLPPAEAATYEKPVTVRVIEPPKQVVEPEPEPPVEPTKVPDAPKPPPEPPKPTPRPATPPPPVPAKEAPPPTEAPPSDHPATGPDTGPAVFGVTMESTSQGGNGPAVQVGNTTKPTTGGGGAPVKDATPKAGDPGTPVAAVEVTKLPLPQGRCTGKYTDDARTAGIEGVVILDLTVDAHGHTRDISVVQGLEHGLTQAAIAALTTCTFTPGEKAGQPVAVRVRGFKIRFVMSDGQ